LVGVRVGADVEGEGVNAHGFGKLEVGIIV
jgi:hypothetical protein